MNTKDPIERLREHYEHMTGVAKGLSTYVFTAADIEEIVTGFEAQYMKLPVDADGVPIHEGDVIQFLNEQGGTGAPVEVCAVSQHYAYYGEGKHFYKAPMCRHVKPDTVERLLEEALDDAMMFDRSVGYFPAESEKTRLVNEYAERIRKAVHDED